MSHQKSAKGWYQLIEDDNSQRLALTGNLTLAALNNQFGHLLKELAQHAKNPDIHWDMTNIRQIDTAGITLLWKAWGLQRPDHLTLRPEHDKMISRIENLPKELPKSKKKDLLWPMLAIGKQILLMWENLTSIITMVGQLALDCLFCATPRIFHGVKFQPTSIVPVHRLWELQPWSVF